MLVATVKNITDNPRKYVVAKVVDNELWYWSTWNDKVMAEQSAIECGDNAFVLEVKEGEQMLHTDDLIRDTEKNIAKGYSEDFTDLFMYAYEKGITNTLENLECIAEEYNIDSYEKIALDKAIEKLKEQK